MWWIVFVALQATIIWSGVRRSRRAGLWNWSKFAFALCFAALECVLISIPLILMRAKNPYFWPVYIAAWVVAALNFAWFIVVTRRWKLADGRTSLEADRERQR